MKKRATPLAADIVTQAERIIAKFGNANRLSKATARLAQLRNDPGLFRSRATVVKWTYPEERDGTGGIIPSSALKIVLQAARLEGILVTADDLYGGIKTTKAGNE